MVHMLVTNESVMVLRFRENIGLCGIAGIDEWERLGSLMKRQYRVAYSRNF